MYGRRASLPLLTAEEVRPELMGRHQEPPSRVTADSNVFAWD